MDIKEVLNQYNELCEDNDWHVFHTPKNLASALTVSSAKIMENFQWITEEESFTVSRMPDRKERLGKEMAETFFNLLALSNKLSIDLEKEIIEKLNNDEATYQGVPEDLET